MGNFFHHVALFLAFGFFGIFTTAASTDKPNVIVILTDDQDLRMNSLDLMENVQKLLIQEGTYFNNHYGHMAQCCPARATIWTGKHAHNTNVTTIFNPLPGGGYRQFSKLGWNKKWLPVYMQNAGYHTYYSGKSFNGFTWGMHCKYGCLEGLDSADITIDPSTYLYYNTSWAHYDGSKWTHIKGNDPPSGLYSTDQISNNVANFIDSVASSDRPFFAVAAPIAPHIPATPKYEYQNLYEDLIMWKSPNFNPDNRTGVNRIWDQDKLTDENVVALDNAFRQRQQCLKSVDDLVENLVNKLNSTGTLNNTYIIYTADNGYHLGNHRMQGGKFTCMEEDVNLPFIIRGPNVGKNKTTDLATGHVDIVPTILTLAGYGNDASFDEIGVQLDGTPITFPLQTEADTMRNAAARSDSTHLEFWGPFWMEWDYLNTTHDYGISFTYKALRLHSPIGYPKPYSLAYSVWCNEKQHELYDMTWDQYQLSNLHPDAPSENGTNLYSLGMNKLLGRPIENLIQRLDALVLVLKTCSDDECRWPWKQLHPNGKVNNLMDALDEQYDNFYSNSYSVAPVGWVDCYTGYSKKHSSTLYSIENEQPAWTSPDVVSAIRSEGLKLKISKNWIFIYGFLLVAWHWG